MEGRPLEALVEQSSTCVLPLGSLPITKIVRDKRACPDNAWMFDEARVYAMLMRGHSPSSEPFRKWVTEEVIPTIRKTGKYTAEESSDPIAQGVMDELA